MFKQIRHFVLYELENVVLIGIQAAEFAADNLDRVYHSVKVTATTLTVEQVSIAVLGALTVFCMVAQ